MIRGFSTRKIEGQKTLGEQLKSVRESLEFSIQDAENGSKVRARFLISLESGDWTNLPTPVYVRGFVLAYAKFLGIGKEEIIRLYEAELSLKKTQNPSEFSYKNSIKDAKVILTPKVLGYALLSTFILIMFGYIFYQVMDFAGSPNLQVSAPSNNLVLETDSTDIRGLTDSDNIISINNETIPVTNDGRFSTSLKLHRGVNVVKVKALNKAKKETTNVITIEYKPKTALIDLERNQ
jgi:cytoskeletal protein RodZ